jgi:hypothetical protein
MKRKSLTIIFITIFSIILWVFVSLDEEYRTVVKSNIRFTHLPDGYSVGYESTNEVALTLKGEGFNLAKLSWGTVDDYEISAKNEKGIRHAYLREELEQNLWLSSSGQVLEIYPEKVDFLVDKIMYKLVPVKLDIKLNFKESYGLVSGIQYSPDSIVISGPGTIIDMVDAVKTEKYEFKNLEKDYTLSLPFEKKDKTEYSKTGCTVSFAVQKIVDKNFDNLRVSTMNVYKGRELMLLPETINLVLRGGIKNLSSMDNDDISVTVNYQDALTDTVGTLKPEITVPEYTMIVDYQPHRLEYIIKQK